MLLVDGYLPYSLNDMGRSVDADPTPAAMVVASLHRYPVKSMLGETLGTLRIDERGADADRRLALVDVETGHVASAKHPRKWAGLLRLAARADAGNVLIRTLEGNDVAADSLGIHELLSKLLGRSVRLVDHRERGATLERPDPEKLLDRGLDAEVNTPVIEIARSTPGSTFHDVAPLHAITTATLNQVGAEALRYRPNLVLATPPGHPPYSENGWVGTQLVVGDVRLRVLKPTHRCVIPTLEHGDLPKAPHALRNVVAENRVAGPDAKMLPCAGVYLEVIAPGTVGVGDTAVLRESEVYPRVETGTLRRTP